MIAVQSKGFLLLSAACFAATALAACDSTGVILTEEEEEKLSIAASARWSIPPDVSALGDGQSVPYTGAGRWVGSSSCAGSMRPGTAQLSDFLVANFPQISQVGGYNCRPIVGNSSRMSVHGTGRALDIHIPLNGSSADNQAGDPIGNWLIANAEDIGIQYIIWDRTQWTASRSAGSKGRRYNGSHPHNDHLHIELSTAGGSATTDWFSGAQEPPVIPSCELVASTGTTIDNDSLCLTLHGNSRYWRSVDGAGHGNDLLWTNAFASNNPSNWAQWDLQMESSGTYDVEVFLDPQHAKFAATRYRLQHGSDTENLEINQSSTDGWHMLGSFEFAAGGGQSLSVFDNTDGDPGAAKSIAVDAIRVMPTN